MEKTKEKLLSENRQFKNQLEIMEKRFRKYRHDVGNPLYALRGWLFLIDRDNNLPSIEEYIQRAFVDVKRISKLIEKAFTLGATISLNIQDVDCNQLIEEIVRDIQIGNEKANDVKITWDILPVIRADASEIARVFQNLIGNAVKFCSDESPTIHISAEQKEKYWLFSVADNGIGMTGDEQKVAFDEGIHNQKYEGEGLGLTICREVMQHHEGGIYVESKLGQGSTFFFTIPIMT